MKSKKVHFIVLVMLFLLLLSVVFIGIFNLLKGHKNTIVDTKGEHIFMTRCASCHSLQKDERRAGPSLYLLFGRKAASIHQFPYSRAMRESEIVWDRQSIKQFLKNPRQMVPQNRMAFVGIEDEAEIDSLLDFLEQNTFQKGNRDDG